MNQEILMDLTQKLKLMFSGLKSKVSLKTVNLLMYIAADKDSDKNISSV